MKTVQGKHSSQRRASPAEDQALQWFVRVLSETMTTPEFDSFDAWIKADKTHLQAYRGLQELWNTLAQFSEKPEVLKIREAIRLSI